MSEDLGSAQRYIEKRSENASLVDGLPTRFWEPLIMSGLKVDTIETDRFICSMKIPQRLLQCDGNVCGFGWGSYERLGYEMSKSSSIGCLMRYLRSVVLGWEFGAVSTITAPDPNRGSRLMIHKPVIRKPVFKSGFSIFLGSYY